MAGDKIETPLAKSGFGPPVTTNLNFFNYSFFLSYSRFSHVPKNGFPLIARQWRSRTFGQIRKHYFTNRVVPIWNSLPNDVVMADNINLFKNHLDSSGHHVNLS